MSDRNLFQMPEAIAEFKRVIKATGQPEPTPKVTLSSANIPSKGWYVLYWFINISSFAILC